MKKNVIKNLIVGASLLASTQSFAQAYIGIDYGIVTNKDKLNISGLVNMSDSQDNRYQDIALKFGGGSDGGFKYQTKISYIKFDKTIFDNENNTLLELGFDIIKEFEVTKTFYPFLKLGVGAGSMKISSDTNVQYSKSNIMEFSYNAGAGVAYKITDHVSMLGGVDYVGRNWQDIEVSTIVNNRVVNAGTISMSGGGAKLYIGLNYAF